MTIVEMLGQIGIPPHWSAVILCVFLIIAAIVVIRVGKRRPLQAAVNSAAAGPVQPASVCISTGNNAQVIAAITAAVNEYSAQVTAAISAAVREYRKSI